MTRAFPVAVHASRPVPTGAAFDIVLLLHLACVLVGLGTVVVSGVQAARVRRLEAGPLPAPLQEYFAPGTNWAGRALYGVPIFGFVLLGMSNGAYGLSDGWVLEGLALWALAAVAAEGYLWPTERRVQKALAGLGDAGPPAEVRRDCQRVCWLAAGTVVVLLLATVLMVAQP